MLDYLTILRMHYSQNLSFREIGASVGCGKTAVGRFITRFGESEFTYPLPQNYSNEQIEAALYKNEAGQKLNLQSLTMKKSLRKWQRKVRLFNDSGTSISVTARIPVTADRPTATDSTVKKIRIILQQKGLRQGNTIPGAEH